jgi:hypothetical protein
MRSAIRGSAALVIATWMTVSFVQAQTRGVTA